MKIFFFSCLIISTGLLAKSIDISEKDPKTMAQEAQKIAKSLASGKAAYFRFEGVAPEGPDKAWTAAGLEAALGSGKALQLGGEAPKAEFLKREGGSRVLLVENKSSVGAYSKSLGDWGWPFQAADFEQLEKAPNVWLDPSTYDMAIFSSPGWWDNFSNPPSGPSRMKDSVAEAVRAFVKKGGTALFIDLAQWDLEKCWPKSLRLASLGPWQLDKFKALGIAKEGKLSLAPEGVAPDKIYLKQRAVMVQQPAFKYPDGNVAPAFAAYAFPDPSGGAGIVAGFAFHVFDQDDSLAGRARRMLLNLLLVSGANRSLAATTPNATAEIVANTTATFTPSSTELISSTPSSTLTKINTVVPPTMTPAPTDLPTVMPTLKPSPQPTPEPTRIPTAVPTVIPSAEPTLVPTAIPSPVWTSIPTLAPTIVPVPTLLSTVAPTPVPTPLPTSTPLPFKRPTAVLISGKIPVILPKTPPLSLAPSPVASFRPTRAVSAPPTAVPVHVRDAIGCIQSSPEPFSEGGVYVFYCLKHSATVTFKVFNGKGRQLYAAEPKFHVPGSHQEFFGGADQKGVPLKPGRYPYRLEAVYDEHSSEWRQSEFNLKRKKH